MTINPDGSIAGDGVGGAAGGTGVARPNPTETGVPTSTAPRVLYFDALTPVADCRAPGTRKVPLTFRWKSTDATQAWFAVGTTNAELHPLEEVPATASGFTGVSFDCGTDQEIYALTVSDGHTSVSASTYVVRQLAP